MGMIGNAPYQGVVDTGNILNNAITADKLSSTAIQDKLGFMPQSPSDVATALASLVNSAPSTLDTLNEIALALGNDANFATTITTSLGLKANTVDVSTALALKANQSTTYTKTETDNLLNGKQNSIADGSLSALKLSINSILGNTVRQGTRSNSFTRTVTGTINANTWTTIAYLDEFFGYDQSILLVSVEANTWATGNTYSGHHQFIINYFGGSTNGVNAVECPLLSATAHALNSGLVVRLRTKENYNANGGRTELQVYTPEQWNSLGSGSGREVYLKVYRLV